MAFFIPNLASSVALYIIGTVHFILKLMTG